MDSAPRLRIVSVERAERAWQLRLPFHYGSVTLTEAAEVHLAVRIEIEGAGPGRGFAAELAAPKWFEKRPDISPLRSVARLRGAVSRAAALAPEVARGPTSLAVLEHALRQALAGDEALADLTALERGFGVALVERACLDALCRALSQPFAALFARDALGLGPLLDRDLQDRWAALRAAPGRDAVLVRHTIGLEDPLGEEPWRDGRPVGLADVIAVDGVTRFKVKLPGEPRAALARLTEVARAVEAVRDPVVTLDANEAFAAPEALADALAGLSRAPELARLWRNVAYVEQPLRREVALDADLRRLALPKPIIIDESDDEPDIFARALAQGYAGTSVKTCKGVLHGLRNLVLARAQGALISLEDLCVQPGIALQQNLALAGVLGVEDCERNGHHYGPGPAALPKGEREAFEGAHPDVYDPIGPRLAISQGALSLRSSTIAPGFGTAVVPEPWEARSTKPVSEGAETFA